MHADFPCNQPLILAGPAGDLEAQTTCPAHEARLAATAVICHPHPLHGGSMQNKVVTTLARGFADLGVASVRFNFRGVGASHGKFADAAGETDDALAVIDWVRRVRPGDALWLAGFSFGAYIALRAAAAMQPAGLITVAPAVQLYDFSDLPMPHCPWLLVQGDADEVVPIDAVRAWLAGLATPPHTVILPGTSHFFHQRLNDLRDALRTFLSEHLPR